MATTIDSTPIINLDKNKIAPVFYTRKELIISGLQNTDLNTYYTLIHDKYFNLNISCYTDENIKSIYEYINHICNSHHKYLSMVVSQYFTDNHISYITRYNTLYPYQNPIYINIGSNRYACNANRIKFINSDFIYYPSQCPILDGYSMPDIDLFLQMIIDNNIKLVCMPITFEPSKTYQWFPTDSASIKIYNIDTLKSCYKDGIPVRNCFYELTCLKTITIVDSQDKNKDESLQTESIKIYQINIEDKLHSKSHQIIIFHYNNWPDMNVPSHINLIYQYIYLIFINIFNSSNKNVLIHCSAGIGRTGTLISCIEMLRYIHYNIMDLKTLIQQKDIDIRCIYKQILTNIIYLRQFRPLTVQNINQFNLIIMVVKFFLYNAKDNKHILEQYNVMHKEYQVLPKCGEDGIYWKDA